MSTNKQQLSITIGAALSSSFSSVFSSGTEKIKRLGNVIKDLEKQSVVGGAALEKLKTRYASLVTSMNKQQSIVAKRGAFRAQILEVAAMGAMLAAPIKSAMEFEDALAGIKAVVQFDAPEDLQKLGDVFTKMSREIPVTADEFANIAAIGGRFGVAAKDLAKFSKEVAKTPVAWGAPVTETAERIGNLMKVFNASLDELPHYYDAINHLGNLTGATADNILKAVNRSSDGLANFKLSIPQAAALTSTIISFGEGAEQAGTAVGSMLQKLSIAPQLGATAQKALHSIGLSSVTLPKMIQADPQKVLDKLLNGVSQLDPEKRSTALYAIFGRGAAKTVGKLVDNLELYRKNLKLVADQKLYNGSRDGDYQIVFETARSQLKLLSNTFTAFVRVVGTSLMPALKKIVSTMNNILSPIISWIEKNKELAQMITTAIAGLIGFRIATFALGYASTFLFGGLNKLVIVFKGLRLATTIAGIAFKTFFFGSAGKFTAILGMIIFAATKLSKTFRGGVSQSVKMVSEKISNFCGLLKNKMASAFSGIAPYINKFKRFIPPEFFNLISKAESFLKSFGNSSKKALMPAAKKIPDLKNKIEQIPQAFTVVKKLMSNFGSDFAIVASRGGVIAATLWAAFKIVSNVFSGFGKVLSIVGGGVGLITRGLFRLAINVIPLVFQVTMVLFRTFWFFSTTVCPFIIQSVSAIGRTFWTLATRVIPTVVSGFYSLVSATLRFCLAPIMPQLQRIGNYMKTQFVAAISKCIAAFKSLGLFSRIAIASLGVGALIYAAVKIYENWDVIKEFFLNFWEDIKARWPKTTSFLGNTFGLIKTTFQFTYQMGVMVYRVLENVVAAISKFVFGADTVIPAWEAVKKFFADFWSGPIKKFEDWVNKILGAGVVEKIKEQWNGLKNFFLDLWRQVTPNFSEWFSPLGDVWNRIKSFVPGFEASKAENSSKLKLSNLEAPRINSGRKQNNNFAITINGTKNDDAESLANKVMNRVSDYNKTFLFDEVSI